MKKFIKRKCKKAIFNNEIYWKTRIMYLILKVIIKIIRLILLFHGMSEKQMVETKEKYWVQEGNRPFLDGNEAARFRDWDTFSILVSWSGKKLHPG